MAAKKSIFFEEWKRCLREHYLHVVRTNDTVTEPTLHGVLMKTGFTEHEIHALKELALCQQQYGDNPFCGQAYEEFLAQGANKSSEPAYLENEPYSEPTYPEEITPENDFVPQPPYLENEPYSEPTYPEEITPENDFVPEPSYLENELYPEPLAEQAYPEEITPENDYQANHQPLELFSVTPLLDIPDESAHGTKPPKKKKSKPATPPPSSADTGQQSLF